ncbi:MAG: hypothetical protein ACEPOW_09615 [Bacteroidales bacterium]
MRKILFICFLSWAFPLFAQESNSIYPGDKEFLKELKEKLYESKNSVHKERSKEILNKLEESWPVNSFSLEQKQNLYAYYQSLLAKKKPAFPFIYEYARSICFLGKSTLTTTDLEVWLKYMKNIPGSKRDKGLLTGLKFTSGFFENGLLNTKSFFSWYAKEPNFQFKFDTAFSIRFSSVDLVCASRNDSSMIRNTTGVYFPDYHVFKGSKGRVFWTRSGLPKEKVFADIREYNQNTTTSMLKFDSVSFNNTKYFPSRILGRFEDKVYSSKNVRASYPRFNSYRKDYYLENIFPSISFYGGVGMEGGTFVGGTDNHNFVKLELKKNGKRYLRSKSKAVRITKKKMSASNAEVVVFFGEDSIYHPGLNLQYHCKRNEISLSRDDRGVSTSPFYNSFHDVDIFADQLIWGLDSLRMAFQRIPTVSRESKINVLSKNYFSEHEFDEFKKIDPLNPLYVVKRYIKRMGGDIKEIYVDDFAKFFKKPREQVILLFLNMSNKGLGVYSAAEKKIIIKEQFDDYLLAKAGRKDYDVLRFNSFTKGGKNAILDLNTYDLKLSGVPEVYLSDSQMVNIYPEKQELILRENRNFIFTGKVHAGLFDFYARECSFDYADFKLKLSQVDSLSFQVKAAEKNDRGEEYFVKVNNVLADLKGELLIDNPKNKSGRKYHPEYPIFDSQEESFVYYDRIPIQDSTLTRDKFLYYVDPFVLDSLDNFSTHALKFKGYLDSGGIFPDIDEPLGVVEDYSLGFKTETGPEGFDIYDGRGKYYNDIYLSNQGFQGDGKLDYLTSETFSDGFVFYPDSLRSITDSVNIAARLSRVEFPPAYADMVNQRWLPYTDRMYFKTDVSPMTFHEQGKFEGLATLAPHGCMGKGVMSYDQSELESNEMKMKHHSLAADTANFNHYTLEDRKLAFSSRGYGTNINFQTRIGMFHATGEESVMEFPFNQYYCSMDEIKWWMDEDRMNLNNLNALSVYDMETMTREQLIDIDLSGSDFVSTHPDQDSLSFFSAKAEYDMKNYVIHAEDVKLIKVADAAVFPGDGKVNILPEAVMESLEDAYIIADTTEKIHNIYNANVDVLGKKMFKANGIYDYKDMKGDVQQILFSSITVDTTDGRTWAKGILDQDDSFHLDPYFYFTGASILRSTRKNLRFKGGFQLGSDCYAMNSSWVQFDTIVDPMNVVLPIVDSLRNQDSTYVRLGLSFSNTQNKFYPSFFEMPLSRDDEAAFNASGVTFYDTLNHIYHVGDPLRFSDSIYSNQYIHLNVDSCMIKGDGKINLLSDMANIEMESYGSIKHKVIPDSTYFDLILSVDFFMNDKLMKMMADTLVSINTDGVDLLSTNRQKHLAQFLGHEEAAVYTNQLREEGTIKKVPKKFQHNLVFNDLKMVWNEVTRSYVSLGRVGLSNIQDIPLNKYVNAYIEIEKRKTGNRFNFYIQGLRNKWYYFSYNDNVMQVLSSDETFNNHLMELPEKKRIKKGKNRDDKFEFVIAVKEDVMKFVNKMERIRRGAE